ncbi:hypothetical protein V2A60_004977 [Cordyceps javanica]|uniref:Uncharacterized protein n=1 Tax=Cordyceps javanica TaxID=43265 RepID=A0A545W9Z7_9HYPO|nr:hypothetical protein IF1G_01721 [Cordyceps javanica]TQW10817.1 hypothetical protein IF2G_01759 [Cordyceps javanica]
MSNRSLLSTLRVLGRVNGSLARQGTSCAKTFSTTTPCGVRATFVETENAELNEVLKTIQEKTIFPAYLPQKQRKIVFNPKMRTFMQSNPIIIEVDGIEHRFSPIDRSKDIPNSKKSFNQAMNLMETPEEWANLGTLLAGYKKAGVKLRSQHWGKIVRRAEETGNIYAVMECAKQVEKTGLKLQTHEMVVRLLAAINDKIVSGDQAATIQAVKWMEVTLELLHRSEQVAHRDVSADTKVHASRLARGLILFTRASAVSAKQAVGEDAAAELTLLKDEVELLKTLWKGADLQNLNSLPEFAVLDPEAVQKHKNLNGASFIGTVAQNIKAISLARQLAPTEAQELHTIEAALSEYLTQYATNDKRRDASWAEVFERITGTAPSWPAVPSKSAKTAVEA